jgi:hypothetical protein
MFDQISQVMPMHDNAYNNVLYSDGARVCEALGKINVGSYNLY